jgi:FkbM family methyltransferase
MPWNDGVRDLVYDIGLHRGEDSAYYLAKGYRVVAFEADPDLVVANRQRFAAGIRDGRLIVVEGAVSSFTGSAVRFYRHPNTVWGTTQETWVRRNLVLAESEPIDVPVIDFAAILSTSGIPYFMKLDIEGAGQHCLETLRSFQQRPAFVSIESEQDDWGKLEDEFRLLEELGYDRFAVVQQACIPGTRISTLSIAGEPLEFEFEPHSSGPFGLEISPWVTRQEALARYHRVFLAYRMFGPNSWLRRTKLGRGLRGQAARFSGRPLPGWFDTHATHSSTIGG